MTCVFPGREFTDYRDYLKAQYLALKAEKPISYTTIGKKMGVTKAFISHVVNKKSHLSTEKVFLCINAFKIPEEMIEHFIFTYFLSISDSPEVKAYLQKILLRITAETDFFGSNPQTAMTSAKMKVTEDILAPILLCMAQHKSFSEDAEWIRNRLALKDIGNEEILKSLKLLLENNILTKEKLAEGGFKYSHDPIEARWPAVTSPNIGALGNVWVPVIEEFSKVPGRYSPSRTTSVTIALTKENTLKLHDLFSKLNQDITALDSNQTNPDHVIHIENIYFTVAKAH